MKISLNSFVGLSFNKSFKLEGEIEGRKVLVLVDSGVSRNVLATRLAKDLGLEVKRFQLLLLILAMGKRKMAKDFVMN